MRMRRVRIYTENVNYADIVKIVEAHWNGFTIFTGTGFWQGTKENCLVIEVITEDYTDSFQHSVDDIVYRIKKHNHQDACLITAEEIHGRYA